MVCTSGKRWRGKAWMWRKAETNFRIVRITYHRKSREGKVSRVTCHTCHRGVVWYASECHSPCLIKIIKSKILIHNLLKLKNPSPSLFDSLSLTLYLSLSRARAAAAALTFLSATVLIRRRLTVRRVVITSFPLEERRVAVVFVVEEFFVVVVVVAKGAATIADATTRSSTASGAQGDVGDVARARVTVSVQVFF